MYYSGIEVNTEEIDKNSQKWCLLGYGFSNVNMSETHSFLGPVLRRSDSVGWGGSQQCAFLTSSGDAAAVVPGPKFENSH